PLFGFMLDVPAVALGLAAVAFIVRGCDRSRWGWVFAAGVLAGAAAQTKYTMIAVPVVLLWYGLLHRRRTMALAACLVAAAVFAVCTLAVCAPPYSESILLRNHAARGVRLDLPTFVFGTLGTGVLLATAAVACVLAVRVRNRFGLRRSADAWFLIGWLAIE